MATIACPRSIDCMGVLDADNPVANLSAEEPDVVHYRATAYNNDIPPGGSNWSSFGCLGICTSDVSQAEADLCAANQAWLCNNYKGAGITGAGGGGTTITPGHPSNTAGGSASPRPDPSIFYNAEQTCSVPCPDGSLFTQVVQAGKVVRGSQIDADNVAYTMACRLAVQNRVCLSALVDRICKSVAFSTQVLPSSGSLNFMSLTAGALPSGLTLDPTSGLIIGTPSATGVFTFTITAYLMSGSTAYRDYSMTVIEITNYSPLADMYQNDSSTMVVFTASAGTVPAINWQLDSGTLPPGLTLDESTGVLNGEPTTTGTYNFVILLQDEAS